MSEVYCRVPSNWFSDPSLCLFEWQTLIGGLIAIGAAVLGAILLRSQIEQAERHETERRSRKFAANRATLPLTLSEITAYARSAIVELKFLHDQITQPSSMALRFDLPDFSNSSIISLRDFIDYSTDVNVNDCICEIIREIQILNSRLNDVNLDRNHASIRLEIEEYIVQAARLNLIVGLLFPYARGTSDSLPTSTDWETIAEHLSVSQDMPRDQYPGVYSVIERRAGAWQSVWPQVRREAE